MKPDVATAHQSWSKKGAGNVAGCLARNVACCLASRLQVGERPTENDELEMWFVVELFVCHSVSFDKACTNRELFSIL